MTKPEDSEKPFVDHFEELRKRLLWCLWAFIATSSLCYLFHKPLTAFFTQPLFAVLPPDKQQLYFTGLFESFLNGLRVSMIGGFLLAMPVIFYQVWAFISPAMHKQEKRMAIPFVVLGTCFFFLGASFAYYFIFPSGFPFFIEFGQPQNIPLITVKEYFSLVFRLLLLFGLSFEFPVVLVFLVCVGVLDVKTLRKNRRTAVIAIAVMSALCAPPDVLSMVLMMVPLYLLYEGSILVASLLERKKLPK